MIGRALSITLFAAFIFSVPVQSAESGIESISARDMASVFDPGPGDLDFESMKIDRTLRMEGRQLESPAVPAGELLTGRRYYTSSGTSRRKRTIVSMLCSAVLPGLGQLYLYRETRDPWLLARAPVYLAAEGYLWFGYKHNYDKGKDIKQDYMDYADEHWNLDRFLEQHPCCEDLPGECVTWEDFNYLCQGEFHYFLYTPRELDEEEYYENIGKYDAFVYGWDDWAGQTDYRTPNRTYYWRLRDESDKYLLRADQHLMLLIVNRVVSMIDAGLAAYRLGNGQPLEQEGWSLELVPGPQAPVLNLGYRF